MAELQDIHPTDHKHLVAYLVHLQATGHPTTTIDTWRSPLIRAALELPHGLCAEAEEIEQWLGARLLARNTRASYATALRRFYHWCLRTKRITADPMADLDVASRQQGTPRPIEAADLALILAHAQQPYRLWIAIAAAGGLRCCEVAGLRREDITQTTVFIRQGKGGQSGSVPTHPALWELVADLPRGLICEGASPKRVSANINKELDRLAHVLVLPHLADYTAHQLRHTAGTVWYQATRDIRATQQLMRHRSPATTAIYTAVAEDALRTAVAAMPLTVASEAGSDEALASATPPQ